MDDDIWEAELRLNFIHGSFYSKRISDIQLKYKMIN